MASPVAFFRRLRFRFGLRSLFLLITLICVWLGWNARVVNERREMLRDAESRGASVIGWIALEDAHVSHDVPVDWSASIIETQGPVTWIRRLLGDRAVGIVYLPSSAFSSDDGERMQDTFPEAVLLPAPFGMQPMQYSFVDDP